MRTWVKVTLGGVALIAVCVLALAGTGAYFVFRNLQQRQAAEAESVKAIEAVKTRFGPRPPLVEIIDPRTANIRIHRPDQPSSTRVDTVHILNWKSDTRELMTTDVPLWLMRFSSVNILSTLGIAPEQFRLTVSDIERYGPGIVADYSVPGDFRLIIWVD